MQDETAPPAAAPEATNGGPAPRRRFQDRAPAIDRFLHSEDRRFVVAREVATGALVVLVVLGLLWGFTGQPIGRSPIVVVESGSMMHCSNGVGVEFGRDCDSRFARLGTIDPGDLILVKDVDRAGDIATKAGAGRSHYGGAGDVIVYRPDGQSARTPIIHRAMFYLEVNGDDTFTIAEFGLSHVQDLDDARIQEVGLPASYASTLRNPSLDAVCGPVGPGRSGFITRGDNNIGPDQGAHTGIANCPVQVRWILGEARGEIPWLGLVKLYATDLPKGCPILPYSTHGPIRDCNYHNAGGDTKFFLFLTVGALLGGPYVYERIKRSRQGKTD
ncbi:MAG: signal peptidase [Thermoplasmata archaeon]|nr:signal peptidase [Thermoplasmata archaeon]MEA3166472.1 signal peptidase [Thermoplasmata archaeon]